MTDQVTTIGEIARRLLEQGYSPAQIRKQLQRREIHWSYSYSDTREDGRRAVHQGGRECLRRMRQHKLCMKGCGNRRYLESEFCEDCLRAKWSNPQPAEILKP